MKLLQITSGLFTENSQSTKLVQYFVDRFQSIDTHLEITGRDLISKPIPHLDASIISAFVTPQADRTDIQNDMVGFSDELIEEFKQADQIVLGLPMYNFGIPSQLKAYFDQLARTGITFKYTDTGPVGLLKDKPVYVLTARGGIHKDQITDTQTDYIKTFFNFLGLSNVQIIYAEGLNMGEDIQSQSLTNAKQAIDAVIASIDI